MKQYEVYIRETGEDKYRMDILTIPKDKEEGDKVIEGNFKKILSDFVNYQNNFDGNISLNCSGLEKEKIKTLEIVGDMHNKLALIKKIIG